MNRQADVHDGIRAWATSRLPTPKMACLREESAGKASLVYGNRPLHYWCVLLCP